MDLSRISDFIIRKRILSFLLYLTFISIIVIGSSYDDLFLVAPPYAVSLYLITFESKSKFSRKKNIIFSYSFVILTTELIHVIMGIGTLPLLLNLILVSTFISFSKFSHPPALALTIFSYIEHQLTAFTIDSVVIMGVVIIAELANERIELFQNSLLDKKSHNGSV